MSRYPLVLALALASCATPPNVAVAGRVALDGATARFEQCGLSVRFAGAPRPLHANEAAHYTSALGRTKRNWQVDGLVYQSFAMAQTAICACRDGEFSDAEIDKSEQAIARSRDARPLPIAQRPFARRVLGVDAPYGRGSEYFADQALFVFPAVARSCTFILGGKFGAVAADGVKAFFATVEPIAK